MNFFFQYCTHKLIVFAILKISELYGLDIEDLLHAKASLHFC